MAASHKEQLESLIADCQKALLDTRTNNNRLVHVNRTAKNSSMLAIACQHGDQIFNLLMRQNGKFRLLAHNAAPPSDNTVAAFYTALTADALKTKLQRFYRDAKTLEQERGMSAFYLAIGFLRWFEDDKSEILREAPLLLVPVILKADSHRVFFEISAREEEEMSANLSLAERLRNNQGLKLPDLPEGDDWSADDYFNLVAQSIAGKERWSIDRSGAALGFFSFAKLAMYQDLDPTKWSNNGLLAHSLIRELMVDGVAPQSDLFSDTTKLDEKFSPSDCVHVVEADGSQALAIETVRAGRNLVVQGPPGTGKSQTITNILANAVNDGKKVLFIAEKMVALDVVHRRLKDVGLGDLCLELHSQKANKKEVSKALAQTLDATADTPDLTALTAQWITARDALNAQSTLLHTLIGDTGQTAFNIMGELVRAQGLGTPPASTPHLPNMATWTAPQYTHAVAATNKLAHTIVQHGLKSQQPWYGVANSALQPLELARLETACTDAHSTLDSLQTIAVSIAHNLAIAAPSTWQEMTILAQAVAHMAAPVAADDSLLRQLDTLTPQQRTHAQKMLQAGIAFAQHQAAEAALFKPMALTSNVAAVRTVLLQGVGSFFYRWRGVYKRAVVELEGWLQGTLPADPRERVKLADRLFALQTAKQQFDRDTAQAHTLFGAAWQGEHTAFADLSATVAWVDALRATGFTGAACLQAPSQANELANLYSTLQPQLAHIMALLQVDTAALWQVECWQQASLTSLAQRLALWRSHITRYAAWGALLQAEQQMHSCGLQALAHRMVQGDFTGDGAAEELRHARAEMLWSAARAQLPALAQLDGDQRSQWVQQFRQLDEQRIDCVANAIKAKHLKNLPKDSIGENAIIKGEAAKRSKHLSIRALMLKAGKTILQIKPIFLMSPISVAQFLPPSIIEFDLLVIDEASQVRPEDALGVIARAKQVVIVGDKKQLPPTNFFNSLCADDDDENDDSHDEGDSSALQGAATADDMESILTLCDARGFPSKMLKWHYRSKHHSLIEVSNIEFYGNGLILPPSPLPQKDQHGLVFKRVAGAYDRGGKRTNRLEAQAIVEALIAHAINTPEVSVGIAAFSNAQCNEINTQIIETRCINLSLDAFLRTMEQKNEVFVKSIENVQGDERDVIFISVGYGPRVAGNRLDSMAFGPINKEGGERRLNVLFTRAREKCVVFASFDPVDIDLSKTTSVGVRVFKRFLQYAQTGMLDQPMATGRDYDSPFEADVAQEIRKLGYVVEPQVGSAGFRIDLAVRHPQQTGRYMLAVECDGATYHSALWARERDRLRQNVLEQMGWTFHRIWSSDWFYRREAQIARLNAALVAACGVSE